MASVCKEWQHVIEKQSFRRLKFQVSFLDEFGHLVVRQRHLVQHIQLNIDSAIEVLLMLLLRQGPAHSHTRTQSSIVAERTRKLKLFRILNTWKRQPGGGLMLKLNTQSPSDWEHCHYFASDTEGDVADEAAVSWHDLPHGWVHGQQVRASPRPAIRSFSENLDVWFLDIPLKVESVMRLIIRCQVRRPLGCPGLSDILKRLRCLEDLIDEPWWPCQSWRSEVNDEGQYLFCCSANTSKIGLVMVISATQRQVTGKCKRWLSLKLI